MGPWIHARAALSPRAPALLHAKGSLAWGELAAQADALARGLGALGVRPGDRVAALLGNDPAFVALLHAASLAGAILVPLPPRHAPPELAFVLADTDARLLVAPADGPLAEAAALAARGAAGTAVVAPAQLRERASHGVGAIASRIDPETPLVILHTSGTTGRPKGAVLSHRAFAASALASAAHLGTSAGDRWLACMPLHHVGGLAILVRAAVFGAAVVLHERFDPQRVGDALDDDGVRLASFVPTMLRRVLDARRERPAPSSLRAVLVGGAACPPALLERAWGSGWPALPTYGLTEACSQVATLPPHEIGRADPGLCGRPLSGTELEIRDEDGRPLPPDEPGEICVRGPALMAGYWRDPAASAAALRGGWLHTGDAGLLTPAGALRVLDRRRDLIVTGGENVYPAEVEAALLAHPTIADAAVAALPDTDLGQRVAAWVVARPGRSVPDLPALRAALRPHLAAFKLPRALHVVASLPRSPSGKLRRRELPASPPRPSLG